MYRKKIIRHLALLWSILFLVAIAGASTRTEQVSPAEKEAFAVNYIELKNVRLLDTPDKMLSKEEQMQNTGIATRPQRWTGEPEEKYWNAVLAAVGGTATAFYGTHSEEPEEAWR